MVKKKTRPQLRTCSVCGKLGHNKSTCPVHARRARTEKHRQKGTVKFFVHHVNSIPVNSPHLVNLKNDKTDIFAKVQAIAPDENYDSLYHFYHQKPAAAVTPSKTGLFAAPLNQTPADILAGARELDEMNFDNEDRAQEIVNRDEGQKSLRRATSSAGKRRRSLRLPSLPRLPALSLSSFRSGAIWGGLTLRRAAFATVVIAAVLIAPFQANSYYQNLRATAGEVTAASASGFLALQDSADAIMRSDITGAQKSIGTALTNFDEALATMDSQYQIIQTVAQAIPFLAGEVQSRQKLLLAGQELAVGNGYLLRGVETISQSASSTVLERVATLNTYLLSAIPNYQRALINLAAVDPDVLPFEYQNTFKDFKVVFTAALTDLQTLSELGQTVNEIFGEVGLRRYLVLFQNPDELRPTGGFIGSFAILDVKDGKIVKLDVPAGGSYDLQGQLSELVIPPSPLQLLKKRWEFQDSNWFPSFPASAEKAMWFYRKSRGVTTDGVIAVNSSVLTRLLSIVGPLTDEKRGLTISSDNAIATIQTVVEEGPEKKNNKPKQIITDLAPKFLEYFQNIRPEHALPLLVNLSDALKQKEIQAYFTDTATETTVRNMGWSGDILSTSAGQDYLMVVNTNIGGQKSDAKIKQTVSHQAEIQPDGSIIDTVVVTREHIGVGGEKLYGANNIDYLRVYAPLGSDLISASGFTWPDDSAFHAPARGAKTDAQLAHSETEVGIDRESGTRVTDEFGKTSFGNWVVTAPGATTQTVFVYRLPFVVNFNNKTNRYQLVAQRQSGCESQFESQIIFPAGWHTAWSDGVNVDIAANGIAVKKLSLDHDSVWSVMMQKD